MKNYSEMMADFLASGPDYIADLPENWKQGRTAFGGLTSALLLAAITNDHSELPPLRTAQINFIGPAIDKLSVRHQMLRRGKNNVTLSGTLDSEAGAGTHGFFTFGVTRDLPQEMDYPLKEITESPDQAPPFHETLEGAPSFLHNMDRRWVAGPRFMEGSDNPDMLIWGRLKDPKSWDNGLLPLIVLADTPPAAFGHLTKPFRALSSMSWHINMLSDDLSTEDGWWLMRSKTGFIKDGYSSQITQVWNSKGRRVMDALQMQALFA